MGKERWRVFQEVASETAHSLFLGIVSDRYFAVGEGNVRHDTSDQKWVSLYQSLFKIIFYHFII